MPAAASGSKCSITFEARTTSKAPSENRLRPVDASRTTRLDACGSVARHVGPAVHRDPSRRLHGIDPATVARADLEHVRPGGDPRPTDTPRSRPRPPPGPDPRAGARRGSRWRPAGPLYLSCRAPRCGQVLRHLEIRSNDRARPDAVRPAPTRPSSSVLRRAASSAAGRTSPSRRSWLEWAWCASWRAGRWTIAGSTPIARATAAARSFRVNGSSAPTLNTLVPGRVRRRSPPPSPARHRRCS